MSGPTPGSPDATAAGCTCPIIDNAGGKGVQGWDGSKRIEQAFWIDAACPLHGDGTGWMPKEKDGAE